MSKADTLGASAAFGAASTARSSRRNLINSAIGGEGAEAAAITELPNTVISDNPDNPRDHLRNLDETVQTVREVGVLLPIIVATTDAWLRERPDRAAELDDGAQYLVVDGHRRLEAARRVGLATLPVRVDNARVATDETLLEAAFVANYHRDDMTDLEEAHALKRLVEYYGSQTKASKRLGIPQNTISTRLSLLKLSPELQKDLVSGARKAEHVRNLGKLSPEEQRAKADERAEAAKTSPSEQDGDITEPPGAGYHGVIIPDPGADTTSSQGTQVGASRASTENSKVPEPRPEPASRQSSEKTERGDGAASMERLFTELSPEQRQRALGRYLELCGDPESFVQDLAAASSAEYRTRVAQLLLEDT